MTDGSIDIAIPDIEKELGRLSSQSDKKQLKACLFTLIIYAGEPRRVKYLQDLVNSILDKFPCRIIFIHGDLQSEHQYFRVNVSSMTIGQDKGQGGPAITCDQITISASQKQLFRVPFLVIPHIVPDLPVYLIWGQNPFEERHIFPHLQPYASRVIFDSECADDVKLFCNEMQMNLMNLKMDVMDINWALVSNWRDMLVQLFDTPEKADELNTCKSITISYNNHVTDTLMHPEIRAIYLQGWLASRLKWRYRQVERFEDNFIISYFGPNNPVVIALSPQSFLDLPPGAIAALDIQTTQGNMYFISRKPNLSRVIVHASSKEKCEVPFSLPLPNIHKGLTFLKEIFYSKLGEHYQEMLKIISQMDFKVFEQ